MTTTSGTGTTSGLISDDEQLEKLMKLMSDYIGVTGDEPPFIIMDDLAYADKDIPRTKPAEPDDPMFGLW